MKENSYCNADSFQVTKLRAVIRKKRRRQSARGADQSEAPKGQPACGLTRGGRPGPPGRAGSALQAGCAGAACPPLGMRVRTQRSPCCQEGQDPARRQARPGTASRLTCDLRLLGLHELAHHGQDILSPLHKRRLRGQPRSLRQLQAPHHHLPLGPSPTDNSAGVPRSTDLWHLHWELEELLRTGLLRGSPTLPQSSKTPSQPCLFPVPNACLTPQDCQPFPRHLTLQDSLRAHLPGITPYFPGGSKPDPLPQPCRAARLWACVLSGLVTRAARGLEPGGAAGRSTAGSPAASPSVQAARSWLSTVTWGCQALPGTQVAPERTAVTGGEWFLALRASDPQSSPAR